jgi:hypothetical protein
MCSLQWNFKFVNQILHLFKLNPYKINIMLHKTQTFNSSYHCTLPVLLQLTHHSSELNTLCQSLPTVHHSRVFDVNITHLNDATSMGTRGRLCCKHKDYTRLSLQTAKLPTLNNDSCMSTSNISNHLF